ncbi:AAA family ATPase [Aureimonas sp. AU22]|uniref:AAA family ATPase n=1 Tax=Aureimonas sp. AU22 TaxID=1638162 RepID=UPI0007815773|nr:AAA family ATPase [Aureimonas sp. AU22]
MGETNFSQGLTMPDQLPDSDVFDAIEDARCEAVRYLSPGLYAMHRELLAAFPKEAVEKICGGTLPLVIGLRSAFHGIDLMTAARATIEFIAADLAPRQPPVIDIIVEDNDVATERQLVRTGLLARRLIVLIRADPPVSAHDALLDACVDVPPVGVAAIRDTLEREYGEDTVPDLVGLPSSIDCDVLDLACTKAGTVDDALRIIQSLAATLSRKAIDRTPPVPLLQDMLGYGEAMTWATDLLSDMAAYRSGEIAWGDVSSRALLVGPPGTGKTSLAASIARTGGLAFFPTSYASWQRSGDGHLGDLLKEMVEVFRQAATAAPSLVFIDEIDSVPSRSASRRSSGWWRSVVNALLERLDGAERQAGVVVIGACNDDSNLDPALIRAGRLDRRLFIDLPDGRTFAGILASHLGSTVSPDSLTGIASQIAGSLSGADAARIARDARRIARRAGRAVCLADVEAIALPAETRSADEVWRIAVHEAGHAVVALASGVVPSRATLLVGVRSRGSVVIDETHRSETLAGDLDTDARIALGGRAAETVLLGSPSTGSGGSGTSDLALATGTVRAGLSLFGFGDTLVHGAAVDPAVLAARLGDLFDEAVDIVSRHRTAVETLARLLVHRRTLTGIDLSQFAQENGLD